MLVCVKDGENNVKIEKQRELQERLLRVRRPCSGSNFLNFLFILKDFDTSCKNFEQQSLGCSSVASPSRMYRIT